MISRDQAWSVLTEFTKSDRLRKHARAVEASMRSHAGRYDEDPEAWGIVGMLHDFEGHPGFTEIAWDQAVNDTANLWQSIFWHALGPERAGVAGVRDSRAGKRDWKSLC